ncbi:MAG: Holliday junction branch migration protein RuvA [Clostridia bacterium]|nr:Holliday junction branch migration protein RuvA [Clostridia bacterium]
MISFIKGEIAEKFDGKIIVENNGIGYEIFVSNNTLVSIGTEGETCKIFTYMQVREDAITLYGFSSLEEKNLFNLLTSISGIGSKVAIAILSGLKISEIIVAIASEDTASLSRIKGLGKKTAERIVLELKDKVSPAKVFGNEIDFVCTNSEAIDEAYQVLLSLGLTKNESMQLARANSAGKDTAEQIVAQVLKNMGR